MKQFSQRTPDYETNSAYIAFRTFLDSYLRERNLGKTLAMLGEDYYGLGTGSNDIAIGKDAFRQLLTDGFEVLKSPIDYHITSVHGKEVAPDIWIILAAIDILLPGSSMEGIPCQTRFTGCFRLTEQGFSVISTHLSEPNYDSLTGLYGRGSGIRAIEQALFSVQEYAFAFFDIDNLKLLNDEYSHSVGDKALQYFAQLLKESFDDRTILARIGGDEFVGLYRDKSDANWVEEVFSKLEQRYCAYIEANYPNSHSSLSIGCVLGSKKRSFEELYQVTDKLMYDIKKAGKRGHKIVELD